MHCEIDRISDLLSDCKTLRATFLTTSMDIGIADKNRNISGITINNHPVVTSVDVMQKAYGNEHTRAAGWYYLQGQNFCSDYFEYQDDVWQYLRDNAQTSQPVIGQIDTLTGLSRAGIYME